MRRLAARETEKDPLLVERTQKSGIVERKIGISRREEVNNVSSEEHMG
jgi:hypothetical protein